MKSKTDTWLWIVCPCSQKLAMHIKDEAIIVEQYIMKFDNTMQFFPQFANRDINYPDKASWMSFQTSDLLQATNCVIKSRMIALSKMAPILTNEFVLKIFYFSMAVNCGFIAWHVWFYRYVVFSCLFAYSRLPPMRMGPISCLLHKNVWENIVGKLVFMRLSTIKTSIQEFPRVSIVMPCYIHLSQSCRNLSAQIVLQLPFSHILQLAFLPCCFTPGSLGQ